MKSHGWRSLVGCSPWDREESDTTERLHFHFSVSCIGEGNGNPLQCSCLENPRDGGAWWAAVYGVAQTRTWLKRLSSSSSNPLFYHILVTFRRFFAHFLAKIGLFLFFFKCDQGYYLDKFSKSAKFYDQENVNFHGVNLNMCSPKPLSLPAIPNFLEILSFRFLSQQDC